MSSVPETIHDVPDEQPAAPEDVARLRARIAEFERDAHDLTHQRRLHTVLYRLGELTWTAQDVDALYVEIHRLIAEHIYAENLFIAVYDKDGEHVHVPYYVDTADVDDTGGVASRLPVAAFLKTLTGYVCRTGAPLLTTGAGVLHLQAAGELVMRGPLMESWLGVPFSSHGKVLGAIVVQSYDAAHVYTTEDQDLLTFVAQQIGLAVVRKRQAQAIRHSQAILELAVERRTEELQRTNRVLEREIAVREKAQRLQTVLYRIAKLTTEDLDLDAFLREIHGAVSELLDAKNFFVSLLEDDMIHFRYFVDEAYPGTADSRPFDPDSAKKGFTERVLVDGEAYLFNQGDPADCREQPSCYGPTPFSWLGVPLQRGERTIGVLAVQSYTDQVVYDESDRELLTFVGQHISTALWRRDDAERLQRAHAELRVSNDQLEERIRERTVALAEANEVLKTALEERKAIEVRLAHAAMHDSLTGLPNRTLLKDRLENTIKRYLRDTEVTYALLFLDLDRFKVVNDSLGHMVGDALLQCVAERLSTCVRPGDTVARLGGDEFCVVLEGIRSVEQAERVAARVVEGIEEVIRIGDHEIFVTASVGIAMGSNAPVAPDALLRDADTAMYSAKTAGNTHCAVFTAAMHERALQRLHREGALRQAVEGDAIYAAFQPIVSLRDGRVVAVEALARWDHPELGTIPPDEFIPLAEETGLIVDLGMKILRRAVSDFRRMWTVNNNLSINVNLSPTQFNQRDLAESVLSLLADMQIPPQTLNLEITESLFIYHYHDAQAILRRLSEAGVGIVLDDFGRGYSSLSYLRDMSFGSLKIDRSFTAKINTNHECRAIVSAVSALADDLGMRVVAEGIETEEDVRLLQLMNVLYGQGYYFAKPTSIDALMEYATAPLVPSPAGWIGTKYALGRWRRGVTVEKAQSSGT